MILSALKEGDRRFRYTGKFGDIRNRGTIGFLFSSVFFHFSCPSLPTNDFLKPVSVYQILSLFTSIEKDSLFRATQIAFLNREI
jgi:hypothetical protein